MWLLVTVMECLLVMCAMRWARWKLVVPVAALLVAAILLREFALPVILRTTVMRMSGDGASPLLYRDIAMAVTRAASQSSAYVVVPAVLLGILVVRVLQRDRK